MLLIDPPGAATHVPNVGLGYICGALRRHGLQARVVDLNLRRDDPQRYLALSRECALVGISVKANVYRQALEIAARIKAASPGIPIVLGGPHINIVGERVMAENPSIDYCIRGEGEESLPALFRALNRADKSHIEGLLWRKDGLVSANACGFCENLDDLEFPEYSDFDSFEIISQGFSEHSDMLAYPLITSRGCPYRCIYCSVGMVMGRRFRARSPQNCLAELQQARERFGIKTFMVLDDTFTQDIDRASELCRLLIDESPPFTWMCPNGVRADHFPQELASLMRQAGCRLVTFGVESSDPEVLAGVKKGVKIETIEEAVGIAKAEGFDVNCFFIVGLPGATIETDYASLNWVLRQGVRASFWMLVPYEGTALWNLKTGRMLDDYTRGSTFGPDAHVVYETDDYPAEDRREFFCVGNYLAPGGRWIPQESFPGGRLKFYAYVLKKSFMRAPRLGLKVAAEVLAETLRALPRQVFTGLGILEKPRRISATALSRLIKNAAWRLSPSLCGSILDRIRSQGPKTIGDAVLIVTGAGKGIGRAVALAAAGQGAQVVAVARTQSDLDSLAAEAGAGILAVKADVSDPRETARIVSLALEKCSRVDILVNNAGVGYFDALEKMAPEEVDAMIDTNFKGAVHMARAVAGPMARRGSGSIINVSSILGLNAGPGESVYAATKFGLIGFTTALAKELKPSGVTVSAICPGAVDTGFADNRNAAVKADALTAGEAAAEVLGCAALGSRIVKLTKNSGQLARQVVNRF
jgi:NAD(P)-dependent dehydrogenase (short-subunit alcohol dehydrogenase family)/radical SAM superfamily enzyme YgiQ (UPF0313 family)